MNSNVNTKQRAILITLAVVIVGMLLHPPWVATGSDGSKMALGYHALWWRIQDGYAASIDIALLLTQWAAVGFVGAVAFVLLASENGPSGGGHQAHIGSLEDPQAPQSQAVSDIQAQQDADASTAARAGIEQQQYYQRAATAVRSRLQKKQWRLRSVFLLAFGWSFFLSWVLNTAHSGASGRIAMGLLTGLFWGVFCTGLAALSHYIEFRKAMRVELGRKKSGMQRAALVVTVLSIAGGVFWISGARSSAVLHVASVNQFPHGGNRPLLIHQSAPAPAPSGTTPWQDAARAKQQAQQTAPLPAWIAGDFASAQARANRPPWEDTYAPEPGPSVGAKLEESATRAKKQ